MKPTSFDFLTTPAGKLSDDTYAHWLGLHQTVEAYRSPFFHPEFTRMMSEILANVEVTIIRSEGRNVGYFPYVRSNANVAQPVGLNFTDYQGMILEDDVSIDPMQVIKAARLSAWNFDHLHNVDTKTSHYALSHAPSHYLDLTGGYDNYVAARNAAGTKIFTQIRQNQRKLEKNCGQIELITKTVEQEDIDWLATMKSSQLKFMKVFDYFENSWTMAFLSTLTRRNTNGFEGLLSKMLVNGQLVAIHLGIHSGKTAHSLIPVYAPDYSKYSPGIILFGMVAEQNARLGIERYELGLGREEFKLSLASRAQPLYTGTVDRRTFNRFVKQSWTLGKEVVRQSSIGPTAQKLVRRIKSLTTPTG
jgi:CelD/BcsL family acetyltransferase involved in cellulose biosynthesis